MACAVDPSLRALLPGFAEGFRDRPATACTDAGILTRICEAFQRAKRDEADAPECYRPGPMWQRILEEDFAELTGALGSGDLGRLGAILGNFQREPCSGGAAGSYLDIVHVRRFPSFRYEYVRTWKSYLDRGTELGAEDPPRFPPVGNPAGIACDGSIVPLEVLRYRYHAMEARELLRGIGGSTVCEIGGGFGGQIYSFSLGLDPGARFVLLDLPETLVLSSYFLLVTLPDARIRLYGEPEGVEPAQITVAPTFAFPSFADREFDLVFNACSLSEMAEETAREILGQIERTCRRYFLHVNHTAQFEWVERGRVVRNLPGDRAVPDGAQFKRIYQHPRVFGRPSDRRFLAANGGRHFAFLYERLTA